VKRADVAYVYADACRMMEYRHHHPVMDRPHLSGLVLEQAVDRAMTTGNWFAGEEVFQRAIDEWRRACDLQDYFIAP
jgi:hypothetical protein